MTKEEAEKQREFMAMNRVYKFCPIIKDMCRPDCMCFKSERIYNVPGQSKETVSHIWEVYDFFCTHPLIMGVISVENI